MAPPTVLSLHLTFQLRISAQCHCLMTFKKSREEVLLVASSWVPLEGTFVVYRVQFKSFDVRIWVTVESSWTKLFLISNASSFEALEPLGFSTSGGKVLFQNESNDLCCYEPGKKIRRISKLMACLLHNLFKAPWFQ
ncbi:hypothetical protein SLA2020_295000 [Shorea laevis]